MSRIGQCWRSFCVVSSTALLLAGCAGTSSVSDALTAGALDKARTGVAVLQVQILGHGCNGGSVTLARKIGDGFSVIRTLHSSSGTTVDPAGNQIMQVEVPADEYHIVNVSCVTRAGRTRTNVAMGQKEGASLFGIGGNYRRSFAAFRVQAGEVVNVGALTIMAGGTGGAHLTVTDLPTAGLQRFKAAKPNLAGPLVTRLMTINRAALSASERNALCASFEELKTVVPSLAATAPPECNAPQAAEAIP